MELNTAVVLFVIEGLLAVSFWFVRVAFMDLKARDKERDVEIKLIKEQYFRKDDFRDFKEELWKRFDKLETSVETLKGPK